jgi:hypothetical protein
LFPCANLSLIKERLLCDRSLGGCEARDRHAVRTAADVGYALYRGQKRRGRVDDALLTVRHFSERSNVPAYFHYLEAQLWAEKGNWDRAWVAWQSFHSAKTKPTR